MMMPQMGGLSVLRHVRDRPGLEGMPVVVYSAHHVDATERTARALGAVDFIVKGTVGWDEPCDRIIRHAAA